MCRAPLKRRDLNGSGRTWNRVVSWKQQRVEEKGCQEPWLKLGDVSLSYLVSVNHLSSSPLFVCACSKIKVKGWAGFLLVFLDPGCNLWLSWRAYFKSCLSFGSCKHCILLTVTWIHIYPGFGAPGEPPISVWNSQFTGSMPLWLKFSQIIVCKVLLLKGSLFLLLYEIIGILTQM